MANPEWTEPEDWEDARDSDGRRMAETGTGSGRSPTGSSNMAEEWRVVPGYPEHIVSDAGRVRHRRVNAPILKGYIDADGYRRVRINGRERRVHRLVCEAFHGTPPAGYVAAHSDGSPANNAASNLRWATQAENVADSIAHGTFHYQAAPSGERHPLAVLSDAQCEAIREYASSGKSQRQVARNFGISQGHVSRILSGKRRNGIAQNTSSNPPTTRGKV